MTDATGSPLTAEALHRVLVELGVSHVVGLPDNSSAGLVDLLRELGEIPFLNATREGEAISIAAGIWLGGGDPVVVIQNTGLLESGDGLRGTTVRMGAPLLLLVTYRGYKKMMAHQLAPAVGPATHDQMVRADLDSVALLTEPTLRDWAIPYQICDSDNDVEKVRTGWLRAHEENRPVALLIPHDLT
jgi:sulfopyruvate decarboxylase TPP-binding subunit